MKLMFWKKMNLSRPIDQAIEKHKKMLKQWNIAERKEIVAALLQFTFPTHHLRRNPRRKE